MEPTIEEYVAHLVAVFDEVRRVLRDDGTLWLNIGDSYSRALEKGGSGPNGTHDAIPTYGDAKRLMNESYGSSDGYVWRADRAARRNAGADLQPKNLCMIPARVALALQAAGWWLRSEITWCKAAPMPESVQDRPTNATEKIYLLSKNATYFYDAYAVRVFEGNGWNGSSFTSQYDRATKHAGRNLWNYWILPPHPHQEGVHFATFPPELVRRCLLAGTSAHGCCAACGAPWRRVVETLGYQRQRWAPGEDQYHTHAKGRHGATSSLTTGYVAIKQTSGWAPTCSCNTDEIQPCVSLDPFGGSGTVAAVSCGNGRRSIYIDNQPLYLDLARQRIGPLACQEGTCA